MQITLEVVPIPVTDVDRAKAFYTDGLGFHADHDQSPYPGVRFVQLTPPGSNASLYLGEGLTDMEPGSQRGVMFVIEDADAMRDLLISRGVEVGPVDEQEWGRFLHITDPDGNQLDYQQLPPDAFDEEGNRRSVPEG